MGLHVEMGFSGFPIFAYFLFAHTPFAKSAVQFICCVCLSLRNAAICRDRECFKRSELTQLRSVGKVMF